MCLLQFLVISKGFFSFWKKKIYIHVLASGSSLLPSQFLRIALSCVNNIDIIPATPPRFGEGLLHSHSLLQRPALCLSHAGQGCLVVAPLIDNPD